MVVDLELRFVAFVFGFLLPVICIVLLFTGLPEPVVVFLNDLFGLDTE